MQGLWNTVCVDAAQAIYKSSSSSVILSSRQGWSAHTWNDQCCACYYTDCLTICMKQKSCFVFAKMGALAGGAAYFPFAILQLLLKTKIVFFCTNYSYHNHCVVIYNYTTFQKGAWQRGCSIYSSTLDLLWASSFFFFVRWFNMIWIVRCLNSTWSRGILCWAVVRWLRLEEQPWDLRFLPLALSH